MRQRRKDLIGVVGALGLAVLVLGFLGGLYSAGLAIALSVSIWALGTALVVVFTNPPKGP